MKRYKLILFFNIFILLTAFAQKIENLVVKAAVGKPFVSPPG